MSNCIQLVDNESVVFTPDEIDVDAFKALVASSKKHDYKQPFTPEIGKANCAWWFLETNHHVIDGKGVMIEFGCGRSSHTWRDFRGLLSTLAPLMKKAKYHTFWASDEFDGFKDVFKIKLNFKVGLED